MSEKGLDTTLHDVMDPIAGKRVSVRWSARESFRLADSWPRQRGRDIDGSALWLLPALYDADAHMPHVQFGVRHSDLQRALAGGVMQMNVALPWHLVRPLDIASQIADSTRSALPRIVPLLSVSPNDESKGFPDWLKANLSAWPEGLPRVVKLYTMDPSFERNLDAVWAAGLKPMVWHHTADTLTRTVARAGDRPIHFRHAVTAAMAREMRQVTNATMQTSPHFLLKLAEGKATSLTVLPPPLPDVERETLLDVFLDQIEMVASDHVAPHYVGDPISPGLQTQQQFLSALLTLSELHSWPLEALLRKAVAAPAAIFGQPVPKGWLLVDPNHREKVAPWPTQTPDRAPFEGLTLRGKVLAVASQDGVELV